MRRGNEEVCVFEIVRPGMEEIPNLQKNRKIQGSDQPARAAATGRAVCMVSFAARDARPRPEERVCRKSSADSNARARVSKDVDGRALMLRDASRRVWAAEAPALASRRDAPQHEGRRATLLSMRAARSTNLRLCEMMAGAVSLFRACYLQGAVQLQRVGRGRGPCGTISRHHPSQSPYVSIRR